MSAPAPAEGLLVHPVGEEVLVYDRRTGRLHWLSPAAAAIWGVCDGQTPAAELTATLQAAAAPASVTRASVVALGVRRLQRAGLLASRETWPAPESVRQLARAVRRQSGATEPRVTNVQLGRAVHAEAAGPCRSTGERCGPAHPPCCPGLECHAGSHGPGVCDA